MTESAPARICIVDDDASVRESLLGLLRSCGFGAEAYSSAEALLQGDGAARASCLIVDMRMPGMSGLELQRELARRRSDLPCIFVTGRGEIAQVVQAMQEGAVDFLVKPVAGEALLASVARALERADDPATAAAADPPGSAKAARLGRLTAREREVAELVAAGFANKEIAHRLGISQRTVDGHRARAMDKLGVRTLPELVRLFLVTKESRKF